MQEALLAQAVLKDGKADVAGAKEYDGRSEPDLERVHVEVVDRELEPEQDVVDDTNSHRRSDTIVREHICKGYQRSHDRSKVQRFDLQAIIEIL